jgi:O-antigen biosynthesis protein
MKITAKPLSHIGQIEGTPYWTVLDVPAQIELAVEPDQAIPSGWVLLRGTIHRRSPNFSAFLRLEFDDPKTPSQCFMLPTSLKGTILELFFIPKGVSRLILEPMRSTGEFELRDLTLTAVGEMERIARMWRRIVPVFFKQPRSVRCKLGLRFHTPFVDLKLAYSIAGHFRAFSSEMSYGRWIKLFDLLDAADRRAIRRRCDLWNAPPRLEMLLLTDDANLPGVAVSLASLEAQLYRPSRISILPSPGTKAVPAWSALPQGIEILQTDDARRWLPQSRAEGPTWHIVMTAGTVLADHACFWFADEIRKQEHASLIYGDHDSLDQNQLRGAPVFKPDWSAELLRSTNYLGVVAALRSDLLGAAGGVCMAADPMRTLHDLWLRASELSPPGAIRHIPAILSHQTEAASAAVAPTPEDRLRNPVADHLQRLGVAASVAVLAENHYRVRYEIPATPPLVSIIVPTRDAFHHLFSCVESVLAKSSYRNFELLIVDNQSTDPQALAYLEKVRQHPQVQVLPYDRPFNYSAINNFAAANARGEILCLLNNDTEVISPDWMEEMLGHLLQPGVGIVGAKLLFGDGRVQHAGDTVGPGGCASHLHSYIDRDAPGYCGRALFAQDLSAVTAACLMTHRSLYLSLDGLNEGNLPVAFNDVDYCLRVREAGFRVVWTPYAELHHYEFVSRGKDDNPEKMKRSKNEANYMRRRWKHVMQHDPFYNPNLSYARPDFSLSNAPRVVKPWIE